MQNVEIYMYKKKKEKKKILQSVSYSQLIGSSAVCVVLQPMKGNAPPNAGRSLKHSTGLLYIVRMLLFVCFCLLIGDINAWKQVQPIKQVPPIYQCGHVRLDSNDALPLPNIPPAQSCVPGQKASYAG